MVKKYYFQGRRLINILSYRHFQKMGYEYILNPNPRSLELHRVGDLDDFFGSHNLTIANLPEFIGLNNITDLPVHFLPDGTIIDVYDFETGELAQYMLNKCRHCFPSISSRINRLIYN